MGNWKSASHNKYLLQYHLIYVCKYRKKLLISTQVADDEERTFFTDGYFICSVGNVSEKTLKEYIENQG